MFLIFLFHSLRRLFSVCISGSVCKVYFISTLSYFFLFLWKARVTFSGRSIKKNEGVEGELVGLEKQNPFPTNYDFNICIIIRRERKKGKFSISSIFFIHSLSPMGSDDVWQWTSSLYILTQFHNMLSKRPRTLTTDERKKVQNWIKFLEKIEMWTRQKSADIEEKRKKKIFLFLICRIEIDIFTASNYDAVPFLSWSLIWCIGGNFSSFLGTNVFPPLTVKYEKETDERKQEVWERLVWIESVFCWL